MKTKTNIGGYERVHLGSNIRKWRSVKGMKQKDLAHQLKISEASLSNIENNLTDLTLSQLEDISISLEIELAELFSDPGEMLMVKPTGSPAISAAESVMEKEIIYALLGSIRKKDEQLDEVIQNIMIQKNSIPSRQAL